VLSYPEIWDLVNRWDIGTRLTRLRNLALLGHGIIGSRGGSLSTISEAPSASASLHAKSPARRNTASHAAGPAVDCGA